jgi:hypothetical protein
MLIIDPDLGMLGRHGYPDQLLGRKDLILFTLSISV